jgi:hypothetical protein
MAGKLKPLDVERETKPGKYADGDGLYLIVTGTDAKNWSFRYWFGGKERWHGLGSFKDVSLKEARLARDAARLRVKGDRNTPGVDIVAEKRAARVQAHAEAVAAAAPPAPTFRERPSLQLANTIINAARAARNPALLDSIAHDSDRMDLAGQSARSPLAVQQSNITDLNAAGNAGQLTPGHYQLITDLQRKYNAISEGLEKNPIATTVSNFPDKVKDPGPLDMSSPENLAAGLKARSKVAQFAAQNWQTAPLPPAAKNARISRTKALATSGGSSIGLLGIL